MSRPLSAATPFARETPTAPGRLIGRVVAAAVLIATAGLVVFELATWDKVTPGVSALGTSLGGASQPEASSRLAPGVQALLDRPLQIRAGERAWNLTPRALGLRLDPAELAAAAWQVGRVGSPVSRLGDQLGALVRGRTISPTSSTDQAALDASLARMAREIERAPRNAHLALTADGRVEYTNAQSGLAVDVPASRDRIAQALAEGTPSVELVVREPAPSIPDEQFTDAREQLERLLGSDADAFTLTFGQQSWPMERPDILNLLSIEGGTRPGEPAVVKIDEAPLRALAARLAKRIDQQVQDARFLFNGGNLKVLRESREGRSLDQAATVSAIKTALLAGERRVALPVDVVEPAVSSANPQALGIKELIDRGSTSFAGSVPEKKHNIKLAAQRLNGVVVPPGGTFSFNKEVGPTTLDAGFEWGFGITAGDSGPKTVPSVAGGICQVATTLFQPVFWSGYQLEERYWHLYWIPAYTSRGVVGLDATVDSDANLDFKWTNPTNDYVLIQADSDNERVYFGLYGKKPAWKVEVDDPIITNRVPPDPRPLAEEEPTLPWGRTLVVETARDGFDVEVKRRVISPNGSKPRELDLKSTYQPAHTVTLVGTRNKPAGASVEEVIQRVLDAQKPAEPKPNPTPATRPKPEPAPRADAVVAAPTPMPPPAAPAQVAPTEAPPAGHPGDPSGSPGNPPTVAPKPATPAPSAPAPAAATPQQKAQSAAGSKSGIAPTPTPSH